MRRLAKSLAAFALTFVTCVGAAVAAPVQAQTMGSSNPIGADGRACAPNIVVNIPGGANSYGLVPQNIAHGGNTREVGVGLRTSNPGRVIDRYASYDSTPGGWRTYYVTRDNGYNTARSIIARDAVNCPNAKFSLFGYSMGADIASRLTQDIAFGRGPIPADRLSSAVFMANPNRGVEGVREAGSAPRSTQGAFGALPGGYGVLTDRVLDICRRGDIVCDTPDAASHMAKSLAKAAVLTGPNSLQETFATYSTLSPYQQLVALPALIQGWTIHNDYAAVGGPAIAMRFIQYRLG